MEASDLEIDSDAKKVDVFDLKPETTTDQAELDRQFPAASEQKQADAFYSQDVQANFRDDIAKY